ncbi:MAG: glutamate--tRNA ligase [Cyclobacteriaceae bacterium]|nr:MAG: glutamate--tRNA ligase [Cyclobacteriaceae bacterium]
MSSVRVRFAPSPTGALHIGGLRTALYNYLFAKSNHGKFVLRIEDTDQARLVPGAEDYIYEALDWLGIAVDESPRQGGDFAPYRQSERLEIYHKYAMQLVEEKKAYYAFDSADELQAMRNRLKAAKAANQQYNAITRVSMSNSLTLPANQVDDMIANGVPYVIRLKIPLKEDIRFEDRVRGWVKVHSSTLDDKVILKSGGFPTYHLANVVDDHLMKITHVIRGEEWLPSAPLHVLLYRFFGWENSMPEFSHLPLILKPDGNGKLSKRDADKQGFPIYPVNWTDPQGVHSTGFRESGYLPETIINFLALLGWNPGGELELFSRDDLEKAFSLDRIVKSGAKFDIDKARWFNQHYLRQKPVEELSEYLSAALLQQGLHSSTDKIRMVVELLRDRIVFPQDLLEQGRIYFVAPAQYDQQVVNKKWNREVASVLNQFSESISACSQWNHEIAHNQLEKVLEKAGWGFGKILPGLRLALTGMGKGPDLMKIMELLGKTETIERLNHAIERLEPIPQSTNDDQEKT